MDSFKGVRSTFSSGIAPSASRRLLAAASRTQQRCQVALVQHACLGCEDELFYQHEQVRALQMHRAPGNFGQALIEIDAQRVVSDLLSCCLQRHVFVQSCFFAVSWHKKDKGKAVSFVVFRLVARLHRTRRDCQTDRAFSSINLGGHALPAVPSGDGIDLRKGPRMYAYLSLQEASGREDVCNTYAIVADCSEPRATRRTGPKRLPANNCSKTACVFCQVSRNVALSSYRSFKMQTGSAT